MKPWKSDLRGHQLEAFIGAYGVRTGQFNTTKELIWFACKLFEIDPEGVETVDDAASRIEALGKKERSERAKRTRGYLFPDEALNERSPAATAGPITQESLQHMMSASKPKMIDGEPFNVAGELDIDPAKLLQKVVSAVISAGRADILWEFPEVLAFFGARIPGRGEVDHLHNVDERMFDAAEKWPNRA